MMSVSTMRPRHERLRTAPTLTLSRSALHYSEYRSFHDETGAHLHTLMGKLEDLPIGDWNLMTIHHKELVDEV